jgi:hypothetical protein
MIAACGGGGDGDTDWQQILADVTEDDLAVMVLPPDQLGDEYEGLAINADDGPLDSTEIADDTIDPSDTAADIEQGGYIAGYDLFVFDESLESLENGEGVFTAGSSVVMFDDEDGAEAALEKERTDSEGFLGDDLDGFVIAASSNRQVSDLGDGAYAYTLTFEFASVDSSAYLTVVQVQLGRLIATVTIARGDPETSPMKPNCAGPVGRIESVARGELDETPVPIRTGS